MLVVPQRRRAAQGPGSPPPRTAEESERSRVGSSPVGRASHYDQGMSAPPQVAIVDDDPHFARLMEVILESHGYRVSSAATLEELFAGVPPEPELVVLDWQLGDQDGLELIGALRLEFPEVQVVLATAHATPALATQALQHGACDFLSKPVNEAHLVTTLASALRSRRLEREVETLRGGLEASCGMIGRSPAIRTVYATIANVAATDVSVLITGESGTGKELVASALHAQSRRAKLPFVALNMAAIPSELVEATLFGHEKGSFSGAGQRRVGAVEEAAGGTLFLDEIGEMPLELQSKLLRFLQERTFRRIGGAKALSADVRIVSATNRDPLLAVEAGRLRADLYYRLNVVPIALPPLRERRGDVALLATAFAHEFAARYERPVPNFLPDAVAALEGHTWPGNVRELRHLIERLLITQPGAVIDEAGLGDFTGSPGLPAGAVTPASLAPQSASPLAGDEDPRFEGAEVLPLAELERRAIAHALKVCGGSRKEAADRLEISQATIYRKLKAYGLT